MAGFSLYAAQSVAAADRKALERLCRYGLRPAPVDQPADSLPVRRTPLPWAQLLRRVFFIAALRCPRCAAAMVILAFLSDPRVVARILRHLRLPTAPPP